MNKVQYSSAQVWLALTLATTTACNDVPTCISELEYVGWDDDTEFGTPNAVLDSVGRAHPLVGTLRGATVDLKLTLDEREEQPHIFRQVAGSRRHYGIYRGGIWVGCASPSLHLPTLFSVVGDGGGPPVVSLDGMMGVGHDEPASVGAHTLLDVDTSLVPGSDAADWTGAITENETRDIRTVTLTHQPPGEQPTLVLDAEWVVEQGD